MELLAVLIFCCILLIIKGALQFGGTVGFGRLTDMIKLAGKDICEILESQYSATGLESNCSIADQH